MGHGAGDRIPVHSVKKITNGVKFLLTEQLQFRLSEVMEKNVDNTLPVELREEGLQLVRRVHAVLGDL